MLYKKLRTAFMLIAAYLMGNNVAHSQTQANFNYLVTCFNNASIDTAEIEINGIGTVNTINLSSNELVETGITYYTVPPNKASRSNSKLAELAANQHISTWKNNSRIVLHDKFKTGDAAVVDLRLHMKIENIYLQVIVVAEKGNMYEIMCFRGTNDKNYFDSLTQAIREKRCLVDKKVL